MNFFRTKSESIDLFAVSSNTDLNTKDREIQNKNKNY